MHTKEKVKMCPHCEGNIPIDATECRYCGSSLIRSKSRKTAYQTEDSLASLYEPPYAPNRKASKYGIGTESSYNYQEEEEEEEPPIKKPRKKSNPAITNDIDNEEEEKTHIGALLLLSIGSQLFTLAWLQFFFSDHGLLTLEWKSRFWPIYLLSSLPFIYHGYKKLR